MVQNKKGPARGGPPSRKALFKKTDRRVFDPPATKTAGVHILHTMYEYIGTPPSWEGMVQNKKGPARGGPPSRKTLFKKTDRRVFDPPATKTAGVHILHTMYEYIGTRPSWEGMIQNKKGPARGGPPSRKALFKKTDRRVLGPPATKTAGVHILHTMYDYCSYTE